MPSRLTFLNLSDLHQGRDNNYNLLRFIAATLVLISHSFVIATGDQHQEPMIPNLDITLGSLAVDIFFITSGFLVCASLVNSKTLRQFLLSRIIRIYPALWLTTLITVLVIGPLITTVTLAEYFQSEKTWSYLYKNSTLVSGIRHFLPGVFADNPWQGAVNGSLWTLPYEIKCYLFLFITGLISYGLKRLKPSINWTVLLVVLIATVTGFLAATADEKDHSIYFTAIFFFGSALYLFKDKIYLSTLLAILVALITSILLLVDIAVLWFYPFALAYLVFSFAYLPSGKIRLFNKLGDYSYGMYIFAFPVQQLIAYSIPKVSITDMVLYSFVLTLIPAVLSWHLLEKPALSLKQRFYR